MRLLLIRHAESTWHRKVQCYYIGRQLFDAIDRLREVTRFADNIQVGLCLEQ